MDLCRITQILLLSIDQADRYTSPLQFHCCTDGVEMLRRCRLLSSGSIKVQLKLVGEWKILKKLWSVFTNILEYVGMQYNNQE